MIQRIEDVPAAYAWRLDRARSAILDAVDEFLRALDDVRARGTSANISDERIEALADDLETRVDHAVNLIGLVPILSEGMKANRLEELRHALRQFGTKKAPRSGKVQRV